jgi:aryl-alcohol dehydrogenase-like predicted oxidoreductase
MKRRDFLRAAAAATPLLGCFPATLRGMTRLTAPGQLEKRALGRTGEMISLIGFGGIVVRDATPDEASERVRRAIDYGVNYFDVAPSYGDAEEKLGPALEPYRNDVFLSCKTQGRTKESALVELERSLELMRTDHFDLYQHHAVTRLEDVQAIFGPGGAMEAFVRARDDGKVRYLGFSAHSVEAALALMDGFDFDTIMFPVNFATWHAGNFGPQVLARAQEKGMGILALKAMARGPWPEGATRMAKVWYEPLASPEDAMMGLRFTLSHPVTSAIPPGHEQLFEMALDLGLRFEPLAEAETAAIKEQGLAGQPLFRYAAG